MAKKRNEQRHADLSQAFEKMDSEIAEGVLRDNLKRKGESAGGTELKALKDPNSSRETDLSTDKPLGFRSASEEGHLRHFLRQLAKLCHLRGDMIPKAQEALTKKFFLNRRDRHHLRKISHAHALRSEEALNHGNAKLSLFERVKAWHKMPKDLSLLLDLAEAYIEPEGFANALGLRAVTPESPAAQQPKAKVAQTTDSTEVEEEPPQDEPSGKKSWLGFGGGKRNKQLMERKDASLRAKDLRKQAKQQKQAARKQKEKIAMQLFELSAWQYRLQTIKYLKKAIELAIGLESQAESPVAKEALAREQARLQKLQQNYPHIAWERYTKRIRALKGEPRPRWPWVLLALLLLTSLFAATVYLPWRSWFGRERAAAQPQPPRLGEAALLATPVPVEWSLPPEQDKDYDKGIQKSQRLKLHQHYAYEVQGHIRAKPQKRVPRARADLRQDGAENAAPQLHPTEPFDLLLTYEYGGQTLQKRISFSHDGTIESSEAEHAPIMEGDTVLFREVFRLPGTPAPGARLLAKIAKIGQAPEPRIKGLKQGGFAQPLNSTDIHDTPQPNLSLAFRDKVMRSDGEKVRLLGYDIELQNNSEHPLDYYALRFNWREEDGIRTKENSPLLQQRDYTIVSKSGANLPSKARTTQRLWLEVPEDLNYPVEQLTPQVRVLGSHFARSTGE